MVHEPYIDFVNEVNLKTITLPKTITGHEANARDTDPSGSTKPTSFIFNHELDNISAANSHLILTLSCGNLTTDNMILTTMGFLGIWSGDMNIMTNTIGKLEKLRYTMTCRTEMFLLAFQLFFIY